MSRHQPTCPYSPQSAAAKAVLLAVAVQPRLTLSDAYLLARAAIAKAEPEGGERG
jgi:hypothetical protein